MLFIGRLYQIQIVLSNSTRENKIKITDNTRYSLFNHLLILKYFPPSQFQDRVYSRDIHILKIFLTFTVLGSSLFTRYSLFNHLLILQIFPTFIVLGSSSFQGVGSAFLATSSSSSFTVASMSTSGSIGSIGLPIKKEKSREFSALFCCFVKPSDKLTLHPKPTSCSSMQLWRFINNQFLIFFQVVMVIYK